MTVPDLIESVLRHIRLSWYVEPKTREFRVREYKRDERALMKAIARYGYECDRRNWQFNCGQIESEIIGVLFRIRQSKAAINYLPLYLEGAVDKYIRQHAEELSAQAKNITRITGKAVASLPAARDVREQTDVEVLSALYRDLKKRKKRLAPAAVAKQESLL